MRVILWLLIISLSLYGSISHAYKINYSTLTIFGDLFIYLSAYSIAIFLYLIPSYLSLYRCHKNHIAISTLNILLGWTLIGWIGSIVWALTSNTLEIQRDSSVILGKRFVGFFLLVLGLPMTGSGFNKLGGVEHALHEYAVTIGTDHGIYFSPWLLIVPGALLSVGALIVIYKSKFFSSTALNSTRIEVETDQMAQGI